MKKCICWCLSIIELKNARWNIEILKQCLIYKVLIYLYTQRRDLPFCHSELYRRPRESKLTIYLQKRKDNFTTLCTIFIYSTYDTLYNQTLNTLLENDVRTCFRVEISR